MADPEKQLSSSGTKMEDEVTSSPRATAEEKNQTPEKHMTTTNESDSLSTAPSKRPPALTRTTSVTPDAIIIPRSKRRGLLAHLTLFPEVSNPYHYTRRTKWTLTFIVAFCAMAAPLGSAIVMPVLHDISHAFGATHTATNMSVAVYMLSMGIFPLWWSSFSERLGRRTIYIASFGLFVVFAVGSAVATNIAMLIVMRTLAGGAAASVQAVGAGTISDIWEVRERGRAMGLFYLGPLCGPLFAPIIGGALGQGLGWRSTQWFLVVYGGLTVVFVVFALPETLPRGSGSEGAVERGDEDVDVEKGGVRNEMHRTTTRASTVQKTKSFLTHMRQIFIDPLKILAWLRYPPVLLTGTHPPITNLSTTVYYASITFGALYILNISIQRTFSSPPYTYPTLTIGLLYIPNSSGYLLASVLGGRWLDAIMHREALKARRFSASGALIFTPLDRMQENAWLAAILWPCSLIAYGWTAQRHVHIALPLAANFLFGVGSMLVFALVNTMLTEFMPRRAASGIALSNFARNLCSFGGAVVAEPALGGVGNGWVMTVLGVWSLVTGLGALGAMRRWGGVWRERMVEELG